MKSRRLNSARPSWPPSPQNILHGRPLRTVMIAPSLRLAHGPLEDGRKRPDERSTQATYFYACSPSSIAASTFGGDIGSSVSRRPVARSIALAMAAIGGQVFTSAAPLAPSGGVGLGPPPPPRPLTARAGGT